MKFWPWRRFASTDPTRNGPLLALRNDGFDSSRPLAFMHIPKTSGMSLMLALDAAFQPATAVKGFDRFLFGTFSKFETFSPAARESVFGSAAALPQDAMLILGHFALSTLQEAYPNAQIITILRNPFVRLLSHWMYWRQYTDAMLTDVGEWGDVVRTARKPLAEFLHLPFIAPQIDNVTLRMLLWPHPLISDDAFILAQNDETLFEAAKERLRAISFVDIAENDQMSLNLQHWLGKTLSNARVNETSIMPAELRTPLHQQLTPKAHERLIACSRLDLRLWTFVAERHLERANIDSLRERNMLVSVARYAGLMAS
jgi:hypothetical protein